VTQSGPSAIERLDPVLAFVNTRVLEHDSDALVTVDGLASWLRTMGLTTEHDTATTADLSWVRSVREALRDALGANHAAGVIDEATLQVLNTAARKAELTASITARGRSELRPDADGVQGAIGALLAIVFGAMDDGTWTRLKVCADDTCRWAFYDHSRARTAKWCSMGTCGNRAKQRAWRQRHGT